MADIDTDRLIWIVTGIALTAEVGDRPLAYRVERELKERLSRALPPPMPGTLPALTPVVISDVYYLNAEQDVQARPTISVGGPGVNMVSGNFTERLPTVIAIEDVLVVQMDLEMRTPHASVWGMTHLDTVRAVELFVTKYLDTYVQGLVAGLAGEAEADA